MSTDNSLPSHKLFDVSVESIEDIARNTKLFILRSAGTLPPSEAGAHIGVHLPNDLVRQYSLLIPDATPNSYSIGVKLDANSTGGSKYMIEQMKLGDALQIEAPRNNFPLEEKASESLFFAGGIGITPIQCMVQRLEQLKQPWKLCYATQSRSDAAFLSELEKLDNVHLHFDDEQNGFLDIAQALQNMGASPTSHLYCCGPTPMLEAFEKASVGYPSSQVHIEYFTSKEESATEGGYVVELSRSKIEMFVPEGKTILDTLRDAGVDAPSSCEEGVCGCCEMKVLSGTPDHRDVILSESERAANDTMMICCSGSKSPRLVLDY